MSEQKVTYSELKFHTPTQQQSRQRAEIAKNKDSPSPLWRIFAVIFGILCLALLVTSGLLGALVCRWQQNFSQQQGILENLTCQQIILENQTRELQEILENLTSERDHLQVQNTNFLNTLLSKGDKCIICPNNWIQHGKDCYELSSGIKSWSVCKEYCSSLGSRLLKIDSKEELDFIKPLTSFPFWMGLLYNETKGYWQWEDGTALTTDEFPSLRSYHGPYCATLKNGKALGYSCESIYFCMCEKESIPLPSKWRCTALILGILCLTLLVTAGILGIQVTQASHLASASLKNLSRQLELLQAKNANLSEVLQQLTSDRGQKCSLCPENWFWYGEVCYHLSTEWKTWQGSKDYCSSHDSRLLKIENKEELDFIVSLSCRLWIGLSRNAVNRTWVWEDGAALPTDLFQVSEIYYEGDCVILEDGKAQSYGCIYHNRCVCKKKSA